MAKKKKYKVSTGTIKANGKVDKFALDIIDAITKAFPGVSGFYIPPNNSKQSNG